MLIRVMTTCATAEEALAFVREQGVVLISAKGAAPSLTEAIVGEPVKGSWWAHPQSHKIFAILETIRQSEQILVCRQIDGNLTLVHRRFWPSLVWLAHRFAPERLGSVPGRGAATSRAVHHGVLVRRLDAPLLARSTSERLDRSRRATALPMPPRGR